MSDNDDDVGYRRPPKKSRFRPGQSGNPSGKRKGALNVATAVLAELQTTVNVRENGREQKVPKSTALAKALVARALKGDTKAFGSIMALLPDHFRVPDEAKAAAEISETERAVLERFITRKINERKTPIARNDINNEARDLKDHDHG